MLGYVMFTVTSICSTPCFVNTPSHLAPVASPKTCAIVAHHTSGCSDVNFENLAFNLGTKEVTSFLCQNVKLFRIVEAQHAYVPAGHGCIILNQALLSTFWISSLMSYKFVEHLDPRVKGILCKDLARVLKLDSKFLKVVKEPFEHFVTGWKLLGGVHPDFALTDDSQLAGGEEEEPTLRPAALKDGKVDDDDAALESPNKKRKKSSQRRPLMRMSRPPRWQKPW